MQSFKLHIPTEIYFGKEKKFEFGEALSRLGSHALLVTGGGSVDRLGYFNQVIELLESQDIRYTKFSGIEPNPHAQTIDNAGEVGRKADVDFVLALGGGSVMDASKAISGLIHDKEDHIWDFVLGEERAYAMKGAMPIACIPTTAATASEVTDVAVISNPNVKGKSVVRHPHFRPSISWLNPAFHTKLPLQTTRDGASDILSHVFENYLLGGSDSPLADRYSEGVMQTVLETLPLVEKDPENEALRGRLLWASTMALNGMQTAGRNSSPFIIHHMEHSLSGYNPSLSHGCGLAILYPAHFRWLWENGRIHERFAQLAHRLFDLPRRDTETDALAFIMQFEKWLKKHGLYKRLSDVGIPEEAYGRIADYTLNTYYDDTQVDVAGPLTREGIIEIFRKTEQQVHQEHAGNAVK